MGFYLIDETKSNTEKLYDLLADYLGTDKDFVLEHPTPPDLKALEAELNRVEGISLKQIKKDELKLYRLEIEFLEKKLAEIDKARTTVEKWKAYFKSEYEKLPKDSVLGRFYRWSETEIESDLMAFTLGNEQYYRVQLETLLEKEKASDFSDDDLEKIRQNRISRIKEKIKSQTVEYETLIDFNKKANTLIGMIFNKSDYFTI